jgi:hypothetical protein
MKEIQDATNAKVSISREGESDPNVHSRTVIITGTEETVAKAQKMINDLLQDGDVFFILLRQKEPLLPN